MAAALLRSLLHWRVPLRLGVPTAAAFVLCALAVPAVWGAMRGLDGTRDGLVLAPGINEREKCLVDGHQDYAVNFTRWVAARVPDHARIAYQGNADPVCVQLALLPRVFAAAGERPQFRVYAGRVPQSVRDRLRGERRLPAGERRIERYARDLLLIRER